MAFKKYTKKSFGKKRSTRVRKAPSRSFAKAVQKVINRNAENKTASIQMDNTSFNSGIATGADVLQLIPSVSQGVDNAQRIGNKIKPSYLDVRGHMELGSIPFSALGPVTSAGTIASNCRIAVRLLIVEPKQYRSQPDALSSYSNWLPQLLQNGSAEIGFTGLTKDLYLPINRDCVTVHYDKIIYLSVPMTYTDSGMSVPLTNSVKFFIKRIKLKKVLSYTDARDQPTNSAISMLCGYAHIDGASPDILTTAVKLSYVSTLHYEDA